MYWFHQTSNHSFIYSFFGLYFIALPPKDFESKLLLSVLSVHSVHSVSTHPMISSFPFYCIQSFILWSVFHLHPSTPPPMISLSPPPCIPSNLLSISLKSKWDVNCARLRGRCLRRRWHVFGVVVAVVVVIRVVVINVIVDDSTCPQRRHPQLLSIVKVKGLKTSLSRSWERLHNKRTNCCRSQHGAR